MAEDPRGAAAVRAVGLVCGYDGRTVLRGVDLQVAAGEFRGVLGPNGSGKSTLLRAITGVRPLQAGTVQLFGRLLGALGRRAVARLVGVVPQAATPAFEYTVREIVAMGRTPYLGRLQSERDSDREAVRRALEQTGSTVLATRLIGELSAGEAQRVAIARALAQEPRILLLDEPTTYLDIGHQAEILDLLQELNDRSGLTIICISHDINLAAQYCSTLTMLDAGQVVAEGPPEEIVTVERLQSIYGTRVVVDHDTPRARPRVTLLSRQDLAVLGEAG